jgi:peptide/nickel transport system permease protein
VSDRVEVGVSVLVDERRSGLSWRRHALLAAGGLLVLTVLLAALLAPTITPYSPYDLDVTKMLQAPSFEHWLGTDEIGRDVLSRTIFAARISVEVALVAVGVGLIGGTIIGLMAAYSGGFVDLAMMRCMDLLFSFPAILLAVVLMASLGTSILNAMIAIGIIFIPGFARLARASSMSVLRQQYIEAARTIGMGHFRILIREILPNAVTPLLVEAAVAFAYAVLLESALSFLGLGAQPPEPSWGNMLNTGRGFMAQAPWLSVVPGMAMFVCVLGFNLLGDGLRDFLDPNLRD